MTRVSLAAAVGALLLTATASAVAQSHPKDVKGARDHPLFNRMPGFYISVYDEKAFDRYEFPVGQRKSEPVEGHVYRITYWMDADGGPAPSALQILRNHQNAINKAGGRVVYDDARYETVMRVSRAGQEIWVHLQATNTGRRYDLGIAEQEQMAQEIVASAEAWKKDLASQGHVAIYGIYFDTDKTDIKPESDATLAEMAKLLSANAALNVFIVGHTDITGPLEHNLQLSQGRATAVATALTKRHAVAAARMSAHGVGPLAPVAANDTEEGRARNRRVELVVR